MEPAMLVTATKTVLSLKKFVEGSPIVDAIEKIGENETNAAMDALKSAKYAQDYNLAVNRALVHLESAHQHLKAASKDIQFMRAGQTYVAIDKDRDVCCLRALCHKYLGDNQEQINICLQDAIDSQKLKYKPLPDNPYKAMADAASMMADLIKTCILGDSIEYLVKDEDFQEFCQNLGYVISTCDDSDEEYFKDDEDPSSKYDLTKYDPL